MTAGTAPPGGMIPRDLDGIVDIIDKPMNLKVSEADQPVFDQLPVLWNLAEAPILLRSLDGGKSGADVFIAQVRPLSTNTSVQFGEYVLKFDAVKHWKVAEPREWERHDAARSRNGLFGEDHIPSLICHAELSDRVAMLYEIAGGSLASFVTANLIDNQSALVQQFRRISMGLLYDFNSQREEDAGVSARSILNSLLGYRLDPVEAEDLHRFVHLEYGRSAGILLAGRVLANALVFCGQSAITEELSRVAYVGMLHGDLHPGNILLDKARPSSQTFWIIDFALSFRGPIGYDHSYLELGTLLRHFDSEGPERQVGILIALEADAGDPSSNSVHPKDVGVKDCLSVIRLEMTNWQARFYPRSFDSFTAQVLLSRVAAGLNWTNKHLKTAQRRHAFLYACWAATRYLELFHPTAWTQIQDDTSASLRASFNERTATSLFDWKGLRDSVGNFNSSNGLYVLVTGSLQGIVDSASLGLLPWSAILDFDPESDEKGLNSVAGPILNKLRALKLSGQEWTSVNVSKGTAWLMAGGWAAHEESAKDDREWGRIYPPLIRQVCEELRSVQPNGPVYVVIAARTVRSIYLQRLLQEVDGVLADAAKIVLIGDLTSQQELVFKSFNGDVAELCRSVRNEYGIDVDEESVFVPARNGRVAIAPERLRSIEEDIELLHDRLVEKAPSGNQLNDEFWKGNAPTWSDLHATIDVRRPIQEDLQRQIEKALEKGDRATITFYHTPGAGGTTVALRAAFENRFKTPVAVLRRYSQNTADRIDDLFHLTQAPVLLIAEASLLPDTDREELYQALALRHVTVIIVHVVRTNDTRRRATLSLFDPMPRDEAGAFERIYAAQTNDIRRTNELREIATSEQHRWSVYRSPFFFGLVTYQEQYKRVYEYVHHCLQGAVSLVQNLLRMLALVTRYSQIGLEESVCRILLDAVPDSSLTVDELLGPGPARLIVTQANSVRLAHHVIATEVLQELMGGEDWHIGLKDLGVHFIREMRRVQASQSENSKILFEDLFIERDVFASEIAARNFAPLIVDAGRATPGNYAGQHELFAELTHAFPGNSHYWNHRARHLIYLVKGDYEAAIAFLDKAIELGAKEGNEMVHYQTKGLAYRFWVNDICSRPLDTPELFSEIRPLVEEAFECFRIAHEKKPNSRYPFVTRIQLTIEVAEALVKASKTGTVHDLIASGGPISSWLQQNYVIAVEDLEMLKFMRADSEPSKYETDCESDLKKLSGDFDDMVRIWETILPGSSDQVSARRGLAVAYFTRGGRDWDNIRVEELTRIVNMMERNLTEEPGNARDIRAWFQAVRRLPSFSYHSALNRLTVWAGKHGSAEAHYYLYIINFLMWRSSRSSIGEEQILIHIKRCKDLTKLRTDYSYEWLAEEPAWCPIIGHRTLGKMHPRSALSLFDDTSSLARISGFLPPNFARQGGQVKIGPRLNAFFVPTEEMHAYKDQQKEINFFLGFSYEGFRAWDPQPGPIPPRIVPRVTGNLTQHAPVESPPQTASSATNASGPKETANEIQAAVAKIVMEHERSGHPIGLSELGDALTKMFPKIYGKIAKEAGFPNLTQLVRNNPLVTLDGVPPKEVVRVKPKL